MKLGDVLKKERERVGHTASTMAEKLALDTSTYEALEGGTSEAETWGPVLAQLAITLETPVGRLLSESGRSQDMEAGDPSRLIAGRRQEREMSAVDVAAALAIGIEQYGSIEAGDSPLGDIGRQLLAFSEVIEQPMFNLFYPCGLPFQELDDYP